ncbi:hypothetical protein G7Y79_00001g003610 [Physcia stellaris]|nr:hypothetical protein G7Y79_00001g003610 [Physcia stellaris]
MGRPAPRPKRGGEEFARTHRLDDEGPSKKPRFDVRNPSALVPDAPEEDAILEADEIGKRGQQTKRNAVNIDGYESDSSNEGFDARADAKAKEVQKNGTNGAGSKDEEEADMFADLEDGLNDGDEDEELAGEGKKQKKNVRFLEADEIEGQVAGSKGGGHVSADFSIGGGKSGPNAILRGKGGDHESSSESDVDDEERADVGDVDEELGAGAKKAHAPKLDAFNMKSEQEEGRFDAQGNFVRKAADPDAQHDTWLEGLSKKDVKKAKEAADKRDEERRQKAIEDDSVLTSDVLKGLIPHIERGETILEALARLNKGQPKKKPKWHNKNKRNAADAMDMDKEAEDPAETRRREAVEAITSAATQLFTRGQSDIYEAEREALMRQYRRETGVDWVDPPAKADEEGPDGSRELKQWEYRWSDARDGGQAHGPYDGAMMVSWNDAGFFGEGVEFRRAGEGGEWSRSVDFI